MGFSVVSQQITLGYSILFGFALAAVYLILSFFRHLFGSDPRTVFFLDLLYFFICTVASVFFFFVVNNGKIRIYIVVSVVLGWIVFFNTVGRILSFCVKKMFGFSRKKKNNPLEK